MAIADEWLMLVVVYRYTFGREECRYKVQPERQLQQMSLYAGYWIIESI